jgi:TfoX/Sxy family transcriptional regulator of competence genes
MLGARGDLGGTTMTKRGEPDQATAKALFDELAADHLGRPGVTIGPAMRNEGLKVDGKLYAMVVRGRLVVKLPEAQAAELTEEGDAIPFEPRPGRLMREWVMIDPPATADHGEWRHLIEDAGDYVTALARGQSKPSRGRR